MSEHLNPAPAAETSSPLDTDGLSSAGPESEDKRCTLFDKPRSFCQRCSEFHTADEWTVTCERYLGAAPIRRCKTCGGDHPLDRWPGNCMPEQNWNRSELASPRIIGDALPGDINGMLSMHDGKLYDSKSAYYRSLREGGCEIVGNDQSSPRRHVSEREIDNDIARDVKDALDQLQTDGLSNDEMGNMLRAPADVHAGFSVA